MWYKKKKEMKYFTVNCSQKYDEKNIYLKETISKEVGICIVCQHTHLYTCMMKKCRDLFMRMTHGTADLCLILRLVV